MVYLICTIGSTPGGDRLIRLNLVNFYKLQGDLTEIEMAKKIGISRSQLWRIKKKNSSVGELFIIKFKKTYPNESFDDYFFIESVDLMERCNIK